MPVEHLRPHASELGVGDASDNPVVVAASVPAQREELERRARAAVLRAARDIEDASLDATWSASLPRARAHREACVVAVVRAHRELERVAPGGLAARWEAWVVALAIIGTAAAAPWVHGVIAQPFDPRGLSAWRSWLVHTGFDATASAGPAQPPSASAHEVAERPADAAAIAAVEASLERLRLAVALVAKEHRARP